MKVKRCMWRRQDGQRVTGLAWQNTQRQLPPPLLQPPGWLWSRFLAIQRGFSPTQPRLSTERRRPISQWKPIMHSWSTIITSNAVKITVTITGKYVNTMSRLMTKPTKRHVRPGEDSEQPGRPPSLIRFFAVRVRKAWVLSYPLSAQRRHWSDRADARADLSLRWAHSHFVGFVTRRLLSG